MLLYLTHFYVEEKINKGKEKSKKSSQNKHTCTYSAGMCLYLERVLIHKR